MEGTKKEIVLGVATYPQSAKIPHLGHFLVISVLSHVLRVVLPFLFLGNITLSFGLYGF